MNEITYQKSYQEYKEELKTELNRTVESFVRIGYLLKVARDTDILKQSEYDNVVDFAKAEYGIDKTQVSRFIHINDKFSEGGYADHLLPEYQGYGYAKLTIMLQLPDAINEGLSPEYTKSEIQQIKDEVDEERKISDLEVMMENRKVPGGSLLKRVIEEIGKDDPELFVEMARVIRGEAPDDAMETMAPDGEKTYSVRVPAEGRIMLMLSENNCRMVNTRSGEKTETTIEEITEEWEKLITDCDHPEKNWSEIYCQPFPKAEKAAVAPVQQKKPSKVQTKKPEKPKKTESEPVAAAEPVKPEMEQETAKNRTETEENKPEIDQNETEPVENEPDQEKIMPAPVENTAESEPVAAAGEKTEEKVEVVTGEIVENTECDTDPADEARINLRIGNIKDRMLAIDGALQAKRWVTAQLAAQDIVNDIGEIIAISMAAGERHNATEAEHE